MLRAVSEDEIEDRWGIQAMERALKEGSGIP